MASTPPYLEATPFSFLLGSLSKGFGSGLPKLNRFVSDVAITQEVLTVIIKSSTALRNDYGMISDLAHEEAEPIYITKNGEGDLVVMSIEAFEQREETLKLRAKLEAAEQARLSGAPTYTLEESRKRLEAIYQRG